MLKSPSASPVRRQLETPSTFFCVTDHGNLPTHSRPFPLGFNMHEPLDPVRKRARTLRQLERKRALDRALQRQKREQQRDYVQRLERDLRDAWDQVDYLRGVIRATQAKPQLGADSADLPQARSVPRPRARSLGSAEPADSAMPRAYQPTLQTLECEQRFIECCCKPKLHKSYSKCFEMTIFNDLIKLHYGRPLIPAIPATPELADIFFLRPAQNPVSSVLYKLAAQPNLDTVVYQSAAYILCYLILRVSTVGTIQE